MSKALNLTIYFIIFSAITYHWLSSPSDTRQSMFYAVVTVFPLLAFNIIFKIYRKNK